MSKCEVCPLMWPNDECGDEDPSTTCPVAAAVAEEREACLELVDEEMGFALTHPSFDARNLLSDVYDAIRARDKEADGG